MLRGVLDKNILNHWSHFAMIASLRYSVHNSHLYNVIDINRTYDMLLIANIFHSDKT
jgi:hypothetical protein